MIPQQSIGELDPHSILISEFTIDRYAELIELWRRTPGIDVRDADSEDGVRRYLSRNPGLSFMAESSGKVIGCAMSGHDGKRGYLQHVVVDEAYRRRGIAQSLVKRCLDGLALAGVRKSHLEVLATNEAGNRYWAKRGWQKRDDIVRYSMIVGGGANT